MAILEKEVWVTLNSANVGYYESLGYEIPKIKSKWGRLHTPRGTEILVKVEDLSKGSHVNVTKVCDDCGKHVINKYASVILLREISNNVDRCKSCGKKYEKKFTVVPYERSFEYFANNNNMEHLLNEYSNKNKLTPDKVFRGSNDQFLWNCPKCKSEYPMQLNNRTCKTSGCTYCAGVSILKGYNDLWTTHHDIAKLLKDKNLGYQISAGSNREEVFECDKCGFEQRKTITNVTSKGFSCNQCSDGISYPEKFVSHVLNQLNINYERQKIFKWSNGRLYDYFIPNNTIIETHGEQHYNYTGFGRTLKEEKENDEYKKRLAKENDILNYIELDCRESNLEFMKDSILKSKLIETYNFDGVDWKEAHEFSINSTLVKIVCDIWNEGIKSSDEIGKIVKLHYSTVNRYLKQGNSIRWCDYNKEEIKMYAARKVANSLSISVVQLTKNNEFIKEWKSATEVENEIGIYGSNISRVCKGKMKTTGGYKWMYKEDYDNLIKIN